MTTIRDVARRAGVSVSTVSHVVNNTRAVSDASRRRVEELGYIPNAVARSLRRQKTNTIGMIMPDSANPFFAAIARGIGDSSFSRDYSVILCNSDGDLGKQAAYTEVLIEKQVAGIVFVAAGVSTELVEDLRRRRLPLVVVDREVSGVEVDTVMTNHYQGGCLATQHLIDLGHRRIACITAGSDLSPSSDCQVGYADTLRQSGITPEDALVERGDFQYESGYAAAGRLLDLAEPPTAIFASNDLMAIGCISAAVPRGLRVPDDLSVIGFDGVSVVSFANPPLTTVAQPKREIGVLAVELLLARIANLDAPHRLERLDTRLVVRQSTARPPA